MKFAAARPYAEPEAAARRLMQIARGIEPVQDGRLHIEKLNYAFLFKEGGSAAEYKAGLDLLLDRKLLFLHESGTYVKILAENDSLLS